MNVPLSSTTLELIEKLSTRSEFQLFPNNGTEVEITALLGWFEQTRTVKKLDEFSMTMLHTSLLEDLNDALNSSHSNKEEEQDTDCSAQAKFTGLALAGTLYFGCEGFDGVSAVMGFFSSSIPTIGFFLAGALFSILSILAFYSLDLHEISKNLEVKSKNTPKTLDLYLKQLEEIKLIQAHLSKQRRSTVAALQEDHQIAQMLIAQHASLNTVRQKLRKALEKPALKIGKIIASGVTGVIFFSLGYFSGQSVVLAIANAFIPAIAATAWPIILASSIVGLAAFSIYWFLQRPVVENLISQWKGLDKEKINALCDVEIVTKETAELQDLKSMLEERISLHEKIIQLENQLKKDQEPETPTPQVYVNHSREPLFFKDEPKNAPNLYSKTVEALVFHRCSSSFFIQTELKSNSSTEIPDPRSELLLRTNL